MVASNTDLFSAYLGLLLLASSSIYVGSSQSLRYINPRLRRHKRDGDERDSDDEEDFVAERMTSSEAWIMPVLGSVALFGLYMAVRYLGAEWINYLLGWYMSIVGVGSIWQCSVSFTKYAVGRRRWKAWERYTFSLTKGSEKLFILSAPIPAVRQIPLAALPSILFSFTTFGRNSALLTDILALSFCFNALSLLRIDTFATGCVLLSGLFIYDIWWVFGTEVMVKVATNLDLPMKLLWPKSLSLSAENGFTMLGLGDVIVPGFFIAHALRYDFYHSSAKNCNTPYPKPFFVATLSAYTAGLLITIAVMHIFQAAQPALLYLSPACIFSFLITAYLRGELSRAWKWTDDDLEEPIEGDRKEL